MRLARVRDWTLDSVPTKHEHTASVFLKGVEVHVPLEGLIDVSKEREGLQKEKEEYNRLTFSWVIKENKLESLKQETFRLF